MSDEYSPLKENPAYPHQIGSTSRGIKPQYVSPIRVGMPVNLGSEYYGPHKPAGEPLRPSEHSSSRPKKALGPHIIRSSSVDLKGDHFKSTQATSGLESAISKSRPKKSRFF